MMNDQYERRALLLHLGDVFATIHAVAKCRDQYASLADAIAADDALSGFPLLHQVAGDMPPAAFVIKASGVFLSWPQALLAEQLDRQALRAESVRRQLSGVGGILGRFAGRRAMVWAGSGSSGGGFRAGRAWRRVNAVVMSSALHLNELAGIVQRPSSTRPSAMSALTRSSNNGL
jgi:hypothetical protein